MSVIIMPDKVFIFHPSYMVKSEKRIMDSGITMSLAGPAQQGGGRFRGVPKFHLSNSRWTKKLQGS